MKKNYIIAFILVFLGCVKEKDKVDEIPIGIIQTTPDSAIFPKLIETFPQNLNNRISNPTFFAPGIQTNIVISKPTLVYLTFINENANIRNTVGWYSYELNKPPKRKSDLKLHVTFPNASGINSSGKLKSGETYQLQTDTFKAGTVIGFFLVSDGYQDGTVVWSQPVLYTNYNLNKDQMQQHVLYVDSSSGDVVLSWEDTPANKNSDSDYNDVVFTVSDNAKGDVPESFNLSGVIVH
jgi:hypothetical protein